MLDKLPCSYKVEDVGIFKCKSVPSNDAFAELWITTEGIIEEVNRLRADFNTLLGYVESKNDSKPKQIKQPQLRIKELEYTLKDIAAMALAHNDIAIADEVLGVFEGTEYGYGLAKHILKHKKQ